jgi:transcriptional regulator
MYDLPYHKERDREVVQEFVREHPFALLTGCGPQGFPVATQVPVFMQEREGRILLRGHLMKGTDHHEAFLQNDNALVIFTGSQVYVSGSWYRDPHTPSTWNYMSVHARGTMRFLEEDALEQVLRETSLHFEDQDDASPTTYDNLPTQLKKRLIKAIVAFEITVTNLDTVFKLSQDRDSESYLNIIEKLKERGEDGRKIAAEMERRIEDVFPEAGRRDAGA